MRVTLTTSLLLIGAVGVDLERASFGTPLAAQADSSLNLVYFLDLPLPLQELRAQASNARSRGLRAGSQSWECKVGTLTRSFRCARDDEGYFVLPPFPTSRRDPDRFGYVTNSEGPYPYNFDFAWVPVGLASEGEVSAAQWRDKAERNVVEECDSVARCKRYFYFLGPNNARSIQFCTVERLDYSYGPPKDCVALMIFVGSERFIRVIVGFNMIPGGSPPGGRYFTVRFKGQPSIRPSVVLEALTRSLTRPPFSLVTERRSNLVRATAGPRVSRILSPWREQVLVRIDVDEGTGDIGEFIGVNVDLTLWVHRRTVAVGMHQPTSQQEERYFNQVLEDLKTALKGLCRASTERDSRTVMCDP